MKNVVSFFVVKILAHVGAGMFCFYQSAWALGAVFCGFAVMSLVCMAALVKVHSPIQCSPKNLPSAAPLKGPQRNASRERAVKLRAGYRFFLSVTVLFFAGCEEKEITLAVLEIAPVAILALLFFLATLARNQKPRAREIEPPPRWVTAEEAAKGFAEIRSAIPVSEEELRNARRIALPIFYTSEDGLLSRNDPRQKEFGFTGSREDAAFARERRDPESR